MEKRYSFFQYLFNDDIYVIHAPKKTETAVFKGIIFFVDYPGIATLPTKEKLFLDKIIDAVKLRLVQVTIVNIPELMKKLSSRALIRFDNAKVVFFTSKIPHLVKQVEIKNRYEITRIENSEFILADVLENIDQDREQKKCLWSALQKLFPQPQL